MASFDIKNSGEHKELYGLMQAKFSELHTARLKFLVLFLIALLKAQTICLTPVWQSKNMPSVGK